MVKFYKLLAISCWLLATSCQEGGDAGDLFGQWRMDGSDSKYISFSGAVTWLQDLEVGEIYGTFQHQGDSLFMQCYSKKGEKSDTIVVEQSFGFSPINNIRLRIVTLDSDNLTLSKDGQTWRFYKY
ncbi:MAG: lipocalin-like domain-containing protein [Prevotella sp.]|nr:lipocalin-like domain-containing protein [Prevotella sp.]